MKTIWSMTLGPGAKWSGVVGRGKLLRFTALGEGANVSMLLYNARDLTERYNMPDTLKAQYTSHLTQGHVLMSDNGRAMAGIVEDGLGWHDAIGGYTTREWTDRKYGATDYQTLRNDWLRSGQENLTVELVRSGLTARDLAPVVNLFAKVLCEDDGTLRYVAGHCPDGGAVTLRSEMELLLVLSNTPHPLDPRTEYPSTPVRLEVGDAPAVEEHDPCIVRRPENRRAYDNTDHYYKLLL